MRHGKKVAKLGRTKSHRDAMLKNLATSVILFEKIKTTPQKAKAVRGIVEHYINIGKSKENYQNQISFTKTGWLQNSLIKSCGREENH